MTEGLNMEGGRGEMTGSFAPRGASEIFCEKGPRPPKGVFFLAIPSFKHLYRLELDNKVSHA